MSVISRWLRRIFDDPQILLLLLLIAGAFAAILLLGAALSPVIAAIVIAFLLDGPASWLKRQGIGALGATLILYAVFLALIGLGLFFVLPPLSDQIVQFVDLLPRMYARLRESLLELPRAYPGIVTETFVRDALDQIGRQISSLGSGMVLTTITGITGLMTMAVYGILVSVMLFFFLKDKEMILAWLGSFLPAHRPLADRVWREVVARAGDYARGKVYEILIVGSAAYVLFALIGLRFPALLAVLTGLSVIIPYIGAAVVTFPVAFVAFFQWGMGSDFAIAVGAYLVLQALDGNVLAPLLFSEVVKLHPNAIILAILVFGSLFGLWGVFFAIPLATLIHAVMKAWPRAGGDEDPAAPEDATEVRTDP
ncbi:MAG: AI-2E family transporter [Rhodothalassiaceae bacterium]